MKCFTLNSHSLVDPSYEKNMASFLEGIETIKPEIMALQESSQSVRAEEIPEAELAESGFIPCLFLKSSGQGEDRNIKIRRDNHAFRIAVFLKSRGLPYFWTWTGAKIGYGKYDEGLALFSRYPIGTAVQFYLTSSHEYHNWKTRKALAITLQAANVSSYVCVHMGWWKDDDEPFSSQWKRLLEQIRPLIEKGPVCLMGDFNSPSQTAGEGFDLIRNAGWQDTYLLAEQKDSGITVPGQIDGWRGTGEIPGMRIDYIWLSPGKTFRQPVRVLRSSVIFDGKSFPMVSDHFGVLAEWKDELAHK